MTTLSRYRHPARIRRVLSSLVPVVCPPEVEALGISDDIVDHVELSLRSMPAYVRTAVTAGIAGYELSAALIPQNRGRVASALDRERAARQFARWWNSRFALQRELAKAVKSLLCLACYEMPAMKTALGYAPEAWIDRVRRRRLNVYKEDIDQHRRALVEPDPLPAAPAFAARAAEHSGDAAAERAPMTREAELEEVAS